MKLKADTLAQAMLKNLKSLPAGQVALRLLVVMGLFSLTRLLFYWLNADSFQATTFKQLVVIFLGGLRFDLTAVLYANSLYYLLMLLPVNGKNNPWFSNILNAIFYLTNGMALALNCIDMAYYEFTSERTTIAVFDEFAHEVNYGQLAYHFIIDYFYIFLIWLGLMALLVWAVRLLKATYNRVNSWQTFALQLLSMLVFIGLAIIGIRSGLPPKQDFPLVASDAGQYVENPGDIVLVQNTAFTMMMSLDKPVYQKQHYYDSTRLAQIYNVNHPADTATFKPLNVVVLIIESLGREPIGVFNRTLEQGKYKGYTPFLDSLAQHALIFPNAYANSRISIEGSPAVLAGIPSMQESFTVSNYSGNTINSIPKLLGEQGYYTAFFHGAPNGSLGLNAFAVQAGIQHYYGFNEYGNPDDYDGVWGIWDHLFLPYAIQTMDSFPKPFMSAVFSVSSHHPHKIPDFLKDKIPEGKVKMHKSIGYADYALKQLFATAKTKDWFNNTLFIITGDHTCTSYYPQFKTPVGAFTVPIILFQPGANLVGVDSTVVQQIDIMPTVLHYLHYPKPYLAFGQDMLHPPKEKFVFNYYGNAFQLIQGHWVIQHNTQKTIGLYNLKEDPLMRNNLVGKAPTIQAKMEPLIKAVIQQHNNRMVDDRLVAKTP